MKRLFQLVALGTFVAAAFACRRESRQARAAPAPPPAAGPFEPRFAPPSNGLLTTDHLDLYVKVRRAAKGRTDGAAALALGVNPEEFDWVRARVVETLVALDARRVAGAAAQTYARSLAAVRQARQRVKDPETARAAEREIIALERERASLVQDEPLPAVVAANAKLVAGRRAEIEAVSR